MAVFDYGLNLQLQNQQAFIDQAGKIDKVFKDLGETVETIAGKFKNFNVGKIDVDLSSITSIDSKTITSKATALTKIAEAYTGLNAAIKTVNIQSIEELNKALMGGAQAATIAKKADALKEMAKALEKIAAIPSVQGVAQQVAAMVTAFSSAKIDTTAFTGLAAASKDVAAIVTAFNKLGAVKLDPALINNITQLGNALLALGNPQIQASIPTIKSASEALKYLFQQIRTLSTSQGAALLPQILTTVSSTIKTLLDELSKLNRPFSGGAKIISQISDIAKAFKDLGIAIRSYGSTNSATTFTDVDANIQKTIAAFNTLISAFKNTKFSDDIAKSVTPATSALVALGSAFETLGRRKGFVDFPNTIALINQAINNLNVQALQELGTKIAVAVPALRDLAEVAKAVAVVNSEAGRAFVQAAKGKQEDSVASRNLLASYIQLTAGILNLIPAVARLLPSLSSVVRLFKDIATAIVSMSFKTVQAGFTALHAVLISLPVAVVKAGITGIGEALRFLGAALVFPITGLRDLGAFVVKLNREMQLTQIGLNVVLAPFRLIYNVLVGLVNVISAVAAGFGRLFSALSPFSKAAGDAAKKLKETNDAGANIEKVFRGTSAAVNESAQQLNNYNTQVQNTNKFARIAVGALQLFAGVLVAKGVTTAVSKLVSMQIAFRTLDALSRAAASGFQLFSNTLTSLVSQAFNAAAEFQRLQISISVLLGREQVQLNPGMFTDTLQAAKQMTGEANRLLESFQLLAVASPFTTTDIAEGFRMAQVYGFSAEESEKLTRATVDLAAGLGLAGFEIAGIIQPLGQMQQVGKANLQDLKQLAARGVPVFDVLAKEFGVTTEKISGMISDGLIPADRAINAIVTSFAKDFKGAAAASTQSLSGLLSTAQDLKDTSLREFFTPIFEAILFGKENGDFSLANLLSLENLQGTIKIAREYGQTIGTSIGKTFQTIIVYVKTFISLFQAIPQPIIDTILNIVKFSAVVLAVTLSLGAFNAIMIALTSTLFIFINPVSLVIGAIVAVGLAVAKNTELISGFLTDLQESLGQLPAFVADLTLAFQNFFQTGQVSQNAFAGLSDTLQFLGNLLVNTLAVATDFGQGIIDAFTSLINTGQASTKGFEKLPGVLKFVATEIFNTINAFVSFVAAIINLPTTINGVATTIGQTFQSMLGDFVDWGANIIQAFADGITDTVGLIGKAIQAIGDILTLWLAPGSPPKVAPELDTWGGMAAMEFVNSFVDTFINGFTASAGTIQNGVGSAFSGIGQAIMDTLVGIGTVAVVVVGGSLVNLLLAFANVGSGIFQIVSSLARGFTQQIGIIIITVIRLVEVLSKPISAFEKFSGVVQAFADAAKLTFANFGATISGVFSGLLKILGGVIAFINGEFLVGFIALGQVSQTVNARLGEIGDGARDFLGGVEAALDGAENSFITTLSNVVDYGSNIVQQFADGMLSTVSYVVDALNAIGDEITYWLAPGSPPRLLPDIDQWGTDAANEFVGAFSEADLSTIGDFGDTIEQLLTSIDVSGVDTEKIVEQFANGVLQGQQTGSFGQENFQAIADLAGEAAPEVLSLSQKYAQLAIEQARLNEVTRQYDKELNNVQGTLDNISRTEGIEQNQQKIESLTNALSNTLLTQTERTRIQGQIQKLQADTRVKQLEKEKSIVEQNTSDTQDAIDLQKKQLQLADKFDNKNTLTGADAQNSLSSASDKAAKAQERLTEAQLKYRLSTVDTAGKIQILREELSKMDEGSLEYIQTLTQIQKLEDQLAREREAEAKRGTAAANRATAEQERINKAELDYRLSLEDNAGKIRILREELAKTQEGSVEYYNILKQIANLEKKVANGDKGEPTALFSGITAGADEAKTSIQETVDNASKKVQELKTNITTQFNAIRDNIKGVLDTIKGYYETWIVNNEVVRASIAAIAVILVGAKIIGGIAALGSALALLSNPVIAIAAGIVALAAAFTYFSVASGGIDGAIKKITDSFTTLQNAFTVGATLGQGTSLDFSSFDMAIATLGINIGAAASNLTTSVGTFFTNLSANFTTGFERFSTFVQQTATTIWTNALSFVGGIFADEEVAATTLEPASTGFLGIIDTYIWTPFTDALSNNDTLLGKVSGALINVGTGIATIIIGVLYQAAQNLEEFLTVNPLGQAIERNVNETVANLLPFLVDSFDLSDAVRTIGENINNTFATLNTIRDGFNTVYNTISEAYNNFIGLFTGAQEGSILSNVIEENRAAFAEFFSEITSPEFISGLQNIGAALAIVAGVIATVAAVIIDVALIGILKNVGDLVIEVGASLGTLGEAFNLFVAGDVFGGFTKAFEGLQQLFDAVFGNIADAIADSVKALLEFFGIDTSGPLGTLIQFIADVVVQFFAFSKLLKVVQLGWNGLVTVFNAGITAIVGLFTGTKSTLTVFEKIIKGVTGTLTFLWNRLGVITSSLGSLWKSLSDNELSFSQVFNAAKDAVTNFFSAIGSSISTKFTEFIAPIKEEGIKFAVSFFTGFFENIGPNTLLAGTKLIAGLGLIDLSGIAKTIMNTLGIDAPEIIESLKTKASSVLTSAFNGIADIAFNISDAIVISEDEEQFIATKIKKFLPDLSTIFGDGTNEKVALKLADYITINEAEVTAIKDTLTGVVDVLSKFVNILPLPQTFKDGLQGILDLFTGELSLGDALTNVYNTFVNIGIALATAFANPFETVKGAIDGLSNPITIVSEGFISLKETIAGLLEIDLSGFTSIFAPVTEAFTAIGEQITNLKSGIEVLNLIPGVDIGDTEVTGADVARESIRNEIETKLADSPFSVETKIDLVTGEEDLALQSKKLIATFTESYAENTTFGITNFAKINRDLIEGGFTATDISALSEKFGLEVPAGLALGLQDTNGDLDRATTGLATNLLSQISEDLGIQSPSTKARDDIGIPFVQGIALGLQDYSEITTALTTIVNSMFNTVTTVLAENALKINIAQSLFTLNQGTVLITQQALHSILELHNTTFNEIKDTTIPDFVSTVEESFTESFENILDLATEFTDEFVNIIDQLQTDVITSLDTLKRKIGDLSNSFKNVGKDLGEALMQGIVDGIEDNTSTVIGAIGTLFGADGTEATEILQKAKDSGIKLGKEFTLGIADGVVAPTVILALKQAVEEMIKEAENAAKKAAGVESPSTLFRDNIGRHLTSGIGVGMLDGLDGLTDVTRSVINRIYSLTKDGVGAQFTTGIIDGISSRQVTLNNTVVDLLANSVVAAKTQLQIHSPSRVTRDGIGVPYVDGITTALENGRGRLSTVAGSLLDVLPSDKTFKYNVQGDVQKQPIEMQYSNLLTSLPSLTQSVMLARQGLPVMSQMVRAVGTANEAMRYATMQNVSNMTESRNTVVSNANTYNYQMNVTTTPDVAARVKHNFEAMRIGRRI